MDVTWDPVKNAKNIRERGLPFSLGAVVLDDIRRLERHDAEHSTPREDRWQTIGLAGKVLFVVYTEYREVPHIISVRLADPEERRLYYGDREIFPEGWYRVNPHGIGNA